MTEGVGSVAQHEAAAVAAEQMQAALEELRRLCAEGVEALPEGGRRTLHLRLLQLRENNRAMSGLQRECKRRVQAAKTALDRTELSRQNLLYERRHLQACIQDARNHPSLYLSIPLEEGHAASDHAQMLERLQGELTGRQTLAERLKSSQESLELARSRLVLKQKELEKVRDQLSSIIKAADPFLNSHSRLFAELERSASTAAMGDDKHHSSDGQGLRALERLMQHWILFAEGSEGVTVTLFEELEAGEDGGHYDGMLVYDEEDGLTASLSGEESSTSVADEGPSDGVIGGAGGGGGGGGRAMHARFASLAKRPGRRFSFAHLMVQISDTMMERSIKAYFYPVDPTGSSFSQLLLVVRVESEALGHQSDADAEEWLLALDTDPILKLTIPHEKIVPGEAGHVPFRWIQSLADILPDASFAEPLLILQKFVAALKSGLAREASGGAEAGPSSAATGSEPRPAATEGDSMMMQVDA